MVKIDRGRLAGRHLVGLARQRDEQRLLLADEDLVSAALAFLEGPRVDLAHLLEQ